MPCHPSQARQLLLTQAKLASLPALSAAHALLEVWQYLRHIWNFHFKASQLASLSC